MRNKNTQGKGRTLIKKIVIGSTKREKETVIGSEGE